MVIYYKFYHIIFNLLKANINCNHEFFYLLKQYTMHQKDTSEKEQAVVISNAALVGFLQNLQVFVCQRDKKHLIRSHCLKEPEVFATSSQRLERPGPGSQVQAKKEEYSSVFHCLIVGPFHSACSFGAFRIDTCTDETNLDYTSFLILKTYDIL